MSLGQWINDFRWAMNVKRARAWRRRLSFSAREQFDHAMRPKLKDEPGKVITYPDAFYHITIDDLTHAMIVSEMRDRANFRFG
jgi:hypothetical protein